MLRVSVTDKERKATKEVIIGLVTQLDLLSYIMEYEKKHKTAAEESGDAEKWTGDRTVFAKLGAYRLGMYLPGLSPRHQLSEKRARKTNRIWNCFMKCIVFNTILPSESI